MINQKFIMGSIASLAFFLSVTSSRVVAQMSHEKIQSSDTKTQKQFQRVEQPLWVKGAVTAGGLGLIGLELWWFVLSKPRSNNR